jgi:EH domain-containing protein 1
LTCRSFNDKPVKESAVGPIGKELFEKEQDDLLSDLKDIPKKACDRRVCLFTFVFFCKSCPLFLFQQINTISIHVQINEFVKRARAAKIHAYIIGHLKNQMPTMMGKAKAQQRLIDNLEDEFAKVFFLLASVAS